jgi:hypothetical protein
MAWHFLRVVKARATAVMATAEDVTSGKASKPGTARNAAAELTPAPGG